MQRQDGYNDLGELTSTDAQGAREAGWGFAYETQEGLERVPGSVNCSVLKAGPETAVLREGAEEAPAGTLVAVSEPKNLKAFPVASEDHIMPLVFSGDKACYIADDTAVADLDETIGIPVSGITDISGNDPQSYIAEHRTDLGNGTCVLSYPMPTSATFRYTEDGEQKSVNLGTGFLLQRGDSDAGVALQAEQAGNGTWVPDLSGLAPGTYILEADGIPAESVTVS